MCAMPVAPTLESLGGEVDPLIGRVINDRYRILEQIGQGGMGRVYRALQAPLDRVVGLKVLGAGHDRDPNFHKRFFLEASVTAKLTHPNTITLFDYGRTDDGIFFIAMEYLAGRTLSAVMQAEGPFAQDRVIHIAQQICRSLREAHALGIVHRDLKPANVMLMRQQDDHDFVKVLDFGLVKFFTGDNPEGEITNAGTFMGSPHYIAPEQARNQSPDQRCDIYSLGILVYQMLTGRVPFTAQNPVDIILKHLHDPPVPPSELRPDLEISPALEQVIFKCLEKDRLDRYQSMDELLIALKQVRAQINGGPIGLSMPPQSTYVGGAPLAPSSNTPTSLLTPSRPMSMVSAGATSSTVRTGKHPVVPPPVPLDISGPAPIPQTVAKQESAKGSRAPLPIAVGIAALALVAVVVLLATRSSHEQPVAPVAPVTLQPTSPAAEPTTARQAPSPSPVAPPPTTLATPAPNEPSAVPTALAGTTLLRVVSTPSGAEVRDVDGRILGATPFEMRVPSNKPLQLTLRADGYKPTVLKERSVTGDHLELVGTLKRDPKLNTRPDPLLGPRRSVGYKDDPY